MRELSSSFEWTEDNCDFRVTRTYCKDIAKDEAKFVLNLKENARKTRNKSRIEMNLANKMSYEIYKSTFATFIILLLAISSFSLNALQTISSTNLIGKEYPHYIFNLILMR